MAYNYQILDESFSIVTFSLETVASPYTNYPSAYAAIDADGNLVVLYTGEALDDGEYAIANLWVYGSQGEAYQWDVYIDSDGSSALTIDTTSLNALMPSGIINYFYDSIILSDSAATLTALSGTTLAAYSAAGVTALSPTEDSITLDAGPIEQLVMSGLVIANADTVILSDSGSALETLSENYTIEQIAAIGVTMISVEGDSDGGTGAMTITASIFTELYQYGIELTAADTITVYGSASEIETIVDLFSSNAYTTTSIDIFYVGGSDTLLLTFDSLDILQTLGITFATADNVALTGTTTELQSLTSSDLATLAAMNVTQLDTDGSMVFDLDYFAAMDENGMSFLYHSDSTIRLNATAADIEAISATEWDAYAATGLQEIVISDGNGTFSAEQVTAIVDAGLSFWESSTAAVVDSLANLLALDVDIAADTNLDSIAVYDTAAHVLAADSDDLVALAALGVTSIDLNDDAMTLSLDAAQLFVDNGLSFSDSDTVLIRLTTAEYEALDADQSADFLALGADGYILAASASYLSALSSDEIAALGEDAIVRIDIDEDAATLRTAQIEAFASAGIAFTDDDVITEQRPPSAVNDQASGGEHATVRFDVSANDTYDAVAGFAISQASVTSGNGAVSIGTHGRLSVTYAGSDLDVGEKARVVVRYTLSDGSDIDTATLRVTFTGVREGGDTILGTDREDTLTGSNDGELIRGLDGDDEIDGRGGDDVILGGQGNDTIAGGAADDTISGGLGNDILKGGSGEDELRGWCGNDRLTGGANADSFVFGVAAGRDVITDFQASGQGQDTIDFSSTDINSFKTLSGLMKQRGDDVLIDLHGGASITLQGVELRDLGADDFLF